MKIGSGIQMLIGGIRRQQGDLKSLLSYFEKIEQAYEITLLSLLISQDHNDPHTRTVLFSLLSLF
jgi:hypothetical protein